MAPGSGLGELLLTARNRDGGWGYYPAKASRLEPTSWAVLARSGEGSPSEPSEWLLARQRADGFLDDGAGEAPNLAFNGLAALALLTGGGPYTAAAKRLIEAIGRTKGATQPTSPEQNNSLQGWSWIQDTFSWVEPTSWCLLALKKAPHLLEEAQRIARIEEAERLLLDRVCETGGWNYGNARMLGQNLPAHVPTTALALLSLQDRRAEPAVQKSFAFLVGQRLDEVSGMALSLTSLCLRVYGEPAPDVDRRLREIAEGHRFFDNLHTAAMAFYSLKGADHGVAALRL